MKQEIWKSVVGYEALYEVSSRGRVRALFAGNGGDYKPRRILKPIKTKSGYLNIILHRPRSGERECRRFRKRLHQIVLEAFRGSRPKGMVSRHLDGVRVHNSLDNLKWGTPKQNTDDMRRHGTIANGERNGFSKLTEKQVVSIRKMRDSGCSCKWIADAFNVHWSTVWLIGQRKTWKHVP